MKIRQGFVSNSSSSSFIVIFPRMPNSIDDVKEMLFGDKTKYYSPYSDNVWDADKVSETVYCDIQGQDKNQIDDAIDILSSSHGFTVVKDGKYNEFECPIDYDSYQKTPGDWKSMDHDAYNEACDDWAKKEFEKFYSLKKIRRDKLAKIDGNDVSSSGDIIYIFNYGDNDGQYYSDLEHGGLFEKLEHITISQH